jgi:hypothetical protein
MRCLPAIFAGLLGLAACGPDYDHTEISAVKSPALGGGLTMQKLDVHEGLIVKAHIVVWNDDKEPMPLDVRAVDPTIVEVAGVVSDRDYAFVGLKAGHTQVEFRADGDVVLTVDADVLPQPDQPPP